MQCPRCHGRGSCTECDGLGAVTCRACDGLGCETCHVNGAENCLPCDRSGICPRCRGEGRMETAVPPPFHYDL